MTDETQKESERGQQPSGAGSQSGQPAGGQPVGGQATGDQPAAAQPESASTLANRAVETLRITKAFQLAVYGLGLAAALVIALLIAGWTDASAVTSVVGLFTSVLGTLVGAFFGLQIGSADKAKAEQRAETAQKKTNALLGVSTQQAIDNARGLYPDLFA